MRKIITSAAALLAAPAFAGGYTAPVMPHPVVHTPYAAPPAAYDWTGAYAGLSYGTQRTKTQREVYDERQTTEKREVYEDRETVEKRQETRPFTKTDMWNELSKTGCPNPDRTYTFHYPDFDYQSTCANLLANTPDAGWSTATVDGHDPFVVREWMEVTGTERVLIGTETVVTGTETVLVGTETAHQSSATSGGFVGYRYQMSNRVVFGMEGSYTQAGGEDSVRLIGHAGYAVGRVLPHLIAGYDFSTDEPVYGAGVDVAMGRNVIGGVAYTRAGDTDRIEARVGWRF